MPVMAAAEVIEPALQAVPAPLAASPSLSSPSTTSPLVEQSTPTAADTESEAALPKLNSRGGGGGLGGKKGKRGGASKSGGFVSEEGFRGGEKDKMMKKNGAAVEEAEALTPYVPPPLPHAPQTVADAQAEIEAQAAKNGGAPAPAEVPKTVVGVLDNNETPDAPTSSSSADTDNINPNAPQMSQAAVENKEEEESEEADEESNFSFFTPTVIVSALTVVSLVIVFVAVVVRRSRSSSSAPGGNNGELGEKSYEVLPQVEEQEPVVSSFVNASKAVDKYGSGDACDIEMPAVSSSSSSSISSTSSSSSNKDKDNNSIALDIATPAQTAAPRQHQQPKEKSSSKSRNSSSSSQQQSSEPVDFFSTIGIAAAPKVKYNTYMHSITLSLSLSYDINSYMSYNNNNDSSKTQLPPLLPLFLPPRAPTHPVSLP